MEKENSRGELWGRGENEPEGGRGPRRTVGKGNNEIKDLLHTHEDARKCHNEAHYFYIKLRTVRVNN